MIRLRHVSATQLAKLAKCEQQLYLDSQYGERHELTQKYINRGNLEHDEFRKLIIGKNKNWFIKLIRWFLRLFIR